MGQADEPPRRYHRRRFPPDDLAHRPDSVCCYIDVEGHPGENSNLRVGAITMLFGTSAGLAPERSKGLSQISAGIKDRSELQDQFGCWR